MLLKERNLNRGKGYRSLVLGLMNGSGLPAAHYPCDEVAGVTLTDLMTLARGSSFDMTLTPSSGGAWTGGTLNNLPGPISRSNKGTANFASASSDYAFVNSSVLGSSVTLPLSMACWVKAAAANQLATLMCVGSSASNNPICTLSTSQAGTGSTSNIARLFLRTNGGTTNYDHNSTAVILDGGWHHVAAVVTSSTSTIYVDGAAQTPASISGSFSTLTGMDRTSLGCNLRAAAVQFFNGQLAQCSFFTVALTANEVALLYLGGLNGTRR